MTTKLPKPLRYIVERKSDSIVDIDTDYDVVQFIEYLAPVARVESLNKPRYRIHLDARYVYNTVTAQQTYNWLIEQLAIEYGSTEVPSKPQPD